MENHRTTQSDRGKKVLRRHGGVIALNKVMGVVLSDPQCDPAIMENILVSLFTSLKKNKIKKGKKVK